MFTFRLKITLALSIASAVLPYSTAFATDGTLGDYSQGDLTMSLTVPNLVRVTGVSDFTFGSYNGSGNAVLDHNLCVYTNNPLGQYKVTLRGSGTAFAYEVTDGATNKIPYSVRWNAATGTGGNFNLDADDQSTVLGGANITSQTCGGGASANMQVTMTKAALLSKPSGAYSGILTIIVEQVP
jgi:hypothetical protein